MTLSPGPPPWPIPPSWTLTAPTATNRTDAPGPDPDPEEAETAPPVPESSEPSAPEPGPVVPEPVASTPAMPENAVAEPVVAENAFPEPAVPENAVPEPVIPEPAVPENAVPEPVIPEPAVPENAVPDNAVPDNAVAEPVIREPAVPEPVVPEPVVRGNADAESGDAAARTIALLVPDDAGTRDVLGAAPGVTVDAKPLPSPSRGFAGVHELADAVARALADGADGVVVLRGAEALEETAWALDLLHASDAPLVLAANPGNAADVADAISVAATAPRGTGCLLVSGGEIHLARHVRRTGTHLPVPSAGPFGYVTSGTVRLLWRPPERITLSGERTEGRAPRVGLHTSTLGDDGELLVALAERCDGLVVTATATGEVPEEIADVLSEAANRIPVILVSPTGHDAFPVTSLDPLKARVLMHLLLATGRDHDAVLSAFAAAAGPGPVRL